MWNYYYNNEENSTKEVLDTTNGGIPETTEPLDDDPIWT
jgi:hypothetical protein